MLSRESQLNDIMKFITDNESKVERILQELEWTEAETLKDDSNKRERANSESHEKSSDHDPLFPPAYPWQHSVVLDKNNLNGIIKSDKPKEVPNKFSDFQVNFNREEKLLIYEYVIKRTGKLLEPELSVTLNLEEGSKRQMTFAEIVALKRDLKRRRIKHRTTKEPPLSYTEEVRNLIEVQMQALNQYLHPHPEKDMKDVPDRHTAGTSRDQLEKDDETSLEEQKRIRRRSRSRSKGREYYKKRESKKRRHQRSSKSDIEDYWTNSKKSAKKMKRHKHRESS